LRYIGPDHVGATSFFEESHMTQPAVFDALERLSKLAESYSRQSAGTPTSYSPGRTLPTMVASEWVSTT